MDLIIVNGTLFRVRLRVLRGVPCMENHHEGYEAKTDCKDEDKGAYHEGPVGTHVFRLGGDTYGGQRLGSRTLHIGILVRALLCLRDDTDDGDLPLDLAVGEDIDTGLAEHKAERRYGSGSLLDGGC